MAQAAILSRASTGIYFASQKPLAPMPSEMFL
jgi:hypothetical protein